MPKSKRKCPKGTFWVKNILHGRARIKGKLVRWSLDTDDPKVAEIRRAKGKAELLAEVHGDNRLTFQALYEQWEQWIHKEVSPKTALRYICSLSMLGPFVAGKFLDQINGKFVADLLTERQKVASNATVRRDLTALSSVMTYAILRGWIEANPVLPKLELLSESRDPIELPDEYSIRAVVKRAPGLFGTMIQAALVTGARQEELASARASQLELKASRLTLRGKGNKIRVISLEPFNGYQVFEGLPAAIGDAPLFWHHNGKRFRNVASRFRFFCRDLANTDPNFRSFRFHDLRHLHAVQYLRAGGSIYDLQHRLGHSSIKVTEMYLDYLTADEARLAKREGGKVAGNGPPAIEQRV